MRIAGIVVVKKVKVEVYFIMRKDKQCSNFNTHLNVLDNKKSLDPANIQPEHIEKIK